MTGRRLTRIMIAIAISATMAMSMYVPVFGYAQQFENPVMENTLRDQNDEKIVPPEEYAQNHDPIERDKEKAFSKSSKGSVTWKIEAGKLIISGNGPMDDYSMHEDIYSPWAEQSDVITSIQVENGVTSIGDEAFLNLENVTAVSLPSSLKTLGTASFCGCSSLSELTIPSGVITICGYLLDSSGVTRINLPATVTELDPLSFAFSNLNEITVDSSNKTYKSQSGVLYSKNGEKVLTYPRKKTGASFTIPDSVKEVGESAFILAENLQQVNLNNVNEIGDWAFSKSGLTSFDFTPTVSKVGYGILDTCSNLTQVSFSSGFSEIPYRTCNECSSLKSIDFGKASIVGMSAFCETGIEELVLPETVRELDVGSFGRCYSLSKVTAKGLVHVAYQSFFEDESLSSLTLNEGIHSIYGQAFYGCTNLTRATIPTSCTWVHENAFPRTTRLTVKNPKMIAYGFNGYMDTLTVTGKQKYDYAYKVLDLVNNERTKKGLSPLAMDKLLLDDAMMRAAETTVLFSHIRPSNQSVVGVFDWFFYSPGLNNVEGENIAYGQSNPAQVMTSWMNSPGHKQNILTAEWKTIGIGCFEYDGTLYWVQTFSTIEDNTSFAKPSDITSKMPIHIESNSFEDSTQNDKPVRFNFDLKGSGLVSVGGKATMTLSLNGVRFNGDSVQWNTSDSSIATINNNGTVEGLQEGSVKIIASSRGVQRASKTVYIGDPKTNTLKIKGKTATVKKSKVKKKNQKLKVSKTITFIDKGQGTKTYKKISGKNKITINKKTGLITVKKGLKKGTYKVKVKVSAAGTEVYKPITKTVTIKIKVK